MSKNYLIATLIFLTVNVANAFSQAGIFDPNDVVVNYDSTNPPVTPPANTLAKWVRTPGLNWNTDKFKAYYYNDMAFRVRFPNDYNPADPTKKYPVILFLHGGGEVAPVTDNEKQLINGAELFQGMIDAGQFNAFMVFPQEKVLGWDYSYLTRLRDVMDSLEKYCHTDPDRLIAMGLSAGAFGAVSYAIAFPQNVSSCIAASPALIELLTEDRSGYVHIPFWLASGGTDVNPSPTVVQNFVDSFISQGGMIRYTFYPTLGHDTWDSQWQEPYLLPTWNAAHKANPLVYFNRTKFLSASAINARIGVSPGFYQYQWQKDNVVLPGAVSNEIFPNQFGSYAVRFKRFSYSDWSDWSPIPAVISQVNPDSTGAGSGLNYRYYEGQFSSLPDFSSLSPVKKGSTANVDISVRNSGVNVNYAFVWEGNINIPTAGTYTFETISDDGSKLYFNSFYSPTASALINNDGLHAPTSVTGNVTIAAGTYPISISFFQKDGGQSMQVYWTGPGISRQLIPDAAFGSGNVTPQSGSGLNYKYYEGDFNTLPDFNSLTPVKTGTSANADISVRPTGVDDHFAFVWQGYINLPAAGTYTFETISDDGSKIYFNSAYAASATSLVNNDGVHAPTSATGAVTVPAAGAYPITITYFEKDGGQTMQLYWTGPGITRQPIPDAAFISGTTISNGGLNYKYYEGNFDLLPDYTALTPVKTGTTNNVDISIRPSGVNNYFAFIWNGYINLPAAGTYTFETISDDGSKVYFNMPYSASGNPLVNNDGLHAPTSATGTVTVPSAGRYPITVTFFQKTGGQTMQLYWTGPGIDRQPVPDGAFTTINSDNGTMVMSGTQTGNLLAGSEDGATTSAMPKVYPNPFVDNFTIDYYNSGSVKNKVSICIFDLNGKLIYTYQPAIVSTGYNSWLINPGRSKLAAGVYITQLKINGVPLKAIRIFKK